MKSKRWIAKLLAAGVYSPYCMQAVEQSAFHREKICRELSKKMNIGKAQ